MLRVDPAQHDRLAEIAANLADRIDEARANGWLGEVQGLQVNLEAARSKLVRLDRAATNQPVDLGLPILGDHHQPRDHGAPLGSCCPRRAVQRLPNTNFGR